jgi:hypothetical protein
MSDAQTYTFPASSSLMEATYNPDARTLKVVFTTGRVYHYQGISPDQWGGLKRAPSAGGYLHREIVHGGDQ